MLNIGQFSEFISTDAIYSEILELGFTHVYEVEHGVEILLEQQHEYVEQHADNKPIISPFCPAIVRLIQVKFPALVDNVMRLKPPVDLAALYNKKKFLDIGYKKDEIGMFYISPCASMVVALRSPVGEDVSLVTGIINMNLLYNKVLTNIKKGKKDTCVLPFRTSLKEKGITWSLTRGESNCTKGRSLAIDGIRNVIEFLEKLENEEIHDIDFLELRACDESCAGGVLTSGNRFLTTERLHKRADMARHKALKGLGEDSILNYKEYILERSVVGKIHPRSMMKVDDNMIEAMRKIRQIHDLMIFLPQVDCGTCGCPSCQALAEDIVQGRASLAQCQFVQRTLEERKLFSREESVQTLENTWGHDKFNRRWTLNL